ncbi:unnamed protein product [Rangifer tarandus platyrhynchus]|uniref:Uncharacterized protein n=1 Tax=Rangifer tarandus platyrhynchus TaxID=3082113 RepID=A0ABN8YS48_RANTA|nr:unnamed protein product [Rangifer tarandus platyrhynchus]
MAGCRITDKAGKVQGRARQKKAILSQVKINSDDSSPSYEERNAPCIASEKYSVSLQRRLALGDDGHFAWCPECLRRHMECLRPRVESVYKAPASTAEAPAVSTGRFGLEGPLGSSGTFSPALAPVWSWRPCPSPPSGAGRASSIQHETGPGACVQLPVVMSVTSTPPLPRAVYTSARNESRKGKFYQKILLPARPTSSACSARFVGNQNVSMVLGLKTRIKCVP